MSKKAAAITSALAATLTLMAGAANAVTVTVEPDNYSGVIPDVAPGATLSTFRYDGAGGYTLSPVLSVYVGNWAPTGTRVFGHRTASSSETAYHWEYMNGAYDCEQNGTCFENFYVFRVDFDTPTTNVTVRTTMRGEMAPDGADLWAFNANGERIKQCRVRGVDQSVIQSGVLPNPKLVDAQGNVTDVACGVVIEEKNCAVGPNADPGECDFVVTATVQRRESDIAYVWFGGRLWQNSYAPVDLLSYQYFK
jgi:hypothetical protein